MSDFASLPDSFAVRMALLLLMCSAGLILFYQIRLWRERRARQLDIRLGREESAPAAPRRRKEREEDENTFFRLDEKEGKNWRGLRRSRLLLWSAGISACLLILALASLISLPAFLVTLGVMAALLGSGWLGLGIWRERRRDLLARQLIEAIDIIIRGARVGMSLQENFQVAARELPLPLGRHFRIMSEKLAIGIDLESVLGGTIADIRLKEFQFMATTLVLQRKSGGQYAEILERLNRLLRDRQAQKLKARALTSEARVSARIVAGVTGVILLILALTNRAQFHFLFDDPTGRNLLIYAALSIAAGFFVISRLLRTLQ